MTQILGSQKEKFLFTCQGVISPGQMREVALKVIRFAGMTPAREHPIDFYPYEGGGGEGYTLFQPLMESYLIADVYTDLNETEVLISTCKPDRLHLEALISFLSKEIGPTTGKRLT